LVHSHARLVILDWNLVQANVDEKGNIRNEIADKWMEYLARGTSAKPAPQLEKSTGN
jgi:phosphoribosylaminoimidazole-succinocarboxamide synthase